MRRTLCAYVFEIRANFHFHGCIQPEFDKFSKIKRVPPYGDFSETLWNRAYSPHFVLQKGAYTDNIRPRTRKEVSGGVRKTGEGSSLLLFRSLES